MSHKYDSYHQSDLGKLYHGDNIKVLKTLENDSVDLMVTDPPFGLSNSEHTDKIIQKAIGSFNDVVFPDFNKGDIEISKYSELVRVLSQSSNLRRVEGVSVGVESWVGVPKGAVDFNYNIMMRQVEITTAAIPTGSKTSDSKLMNEGDVKGGEFVGDFIFDFGNAIDFPTSKSKGCSLGKFFSGLFTVPVSSILTPLGPNLQTDQPPFFKADDFLKHIRLSNDTLSEADRSPFVLADWRTKNGFMLTFDAARGTGELTVADRTEQGDSCGSLLSPQLVRTFAGASCLSAMFKPLTVSFVIQTTDGAVPVYFHLWVPKSFSSILNQLKRTRKGFMGKEWDGEVPPVELWKECLRVMKPGAFAFVMSAPRQDVMARMIINLEDAGFVTSFSSVYWTYATGFPKALNIGKAIDRKLGAEREVVGKYSPPDGKNWNLKQAEDLSVDHAKPTFTASGTRTLDITAPASTEAKALDGSYGGFQPKPAVEVILVAMKPMDEKTFVDQALKNGKGVTWLGKGTIPFVGDKDRESSEIGFEHPYMSENANEGWKRPCHENYKEWNPNNKGRFPANLLVSDDVLNDGRIFDKGGSIKNAGARDNKVYGADNNERGDFAAYGDVGSFSKYFDLDRWFDGMLKNLPPEVKRVFPFLIVPKPAKSEKNKGLERLSIKNDHATVKPVRLKSYLITIGGRPGDVVLDPYSGSGTTPTACEMLGYKYIAIDEDEHSCNIAAARVADESAQGKLL